MKEKSKKIISIAIVLFMVLNYFVPVINYAEDNAKEGTEEQTETEEIGREYEIKETEEWDISEKGDKSVIAKWNLADKSITISGKGNMKDWKYNSTEDWHGKYKNATEKVIINNGITNIGEYAFYEYSNLTEITIPNSVINIGYRAFYRCSSLEEITIPSGVTKIVSDAFYGCSSLKEITIPNSVTSIEWYAFSGCSSLKEIIIPSSVISIEYSAFYLCSSLEEIKVSSESKNYTSIDGVLYNKDKTKIIAYPANKSGEKYSIPDSVTIIGCAFSGCSSLEEITIPSGVTSIGYYAFYGCSSLKKITIPNSVASIGDSAFKGVKYIVCKTNSYAHEYAEENKINYYLLDNEISKYTDLYEIKKAEEWDISENSDKSAIAKWDLADGSITISGKGNMKNWKDNSTEDWYGKYKKAIEKVIINNGITNIGDIAFYGCSSLKEIIIPSSVTSIGYSAFYLCSSLKEITIPNSVASIGSCAFCECSSLKEITIPNSVASIGFAAFNGCSSLKEITIPSGVTRIEWLAFNKCSSLEEIKVSSENKDYTSIDGVLYNKNKTEIIVYPANKPGEKYIILDSVTSIESHAFYGCNSLKEITVPNSVTSIGSYAFKGSSNLKEIIIPSSVTSIESDAFDGVKYIICKTNSYAHRYAEENKVLYKLDEKPPEIKVEYSITKLTNQNVTATITSNEKLQEVVGWTLLEDKKTLTKEYEQNAEEEIIVKDLVGNEVKQTIKITNIDKEKPKLNVDYSTKELTNKNVIVTITSNEQIKGVSGWTLSTNKKTLTKEYLQNKEEEVTVKDLAGNEVKQTIKITNIDKEKPKLNVDCSTKELTNKNVIVTITSNEPIQNVSGWTLSENKKTLTKEYEKNAEEEIIVKDLVGNEVKQAIKVANMVQATGDITQDGVVNIGDLLKLKQHIAYEQSETTKTNHPNWKLDEEKVLIGDVNKNGKIDIGDVLKLRRYIAASTSKEIAEKHSDWLNI